MQVLSGHVHSYERSLPMFNYSVDPCGVQYISVVSGSCSALCAASLLAWGMTLQHKWCGPSVARLHGCLVLATAHLLHLSAG